MTSCYSNAIITATTNDSHLNIIKTNNTSNKTSGPTDSGITLNIYIHPYTLNIQLTTSGRNLTISEKNIYLINIFPKISNIPVKTHLILSINHSIKHIAFATYTLIS